MRKRSVPATVLTWTLAVIWIVPLIGLLAASLRPFEEIVRGWWMIADGVTLDLSSYWRALTFRSAPIYHGLINSLIITVPSTVIPIAVAFLAGYVLSRYRPRYTTAFMGILILFIVMPSEALIIPLFNTFNDIGLGGTQTAVVLVNSARAVPWITVFMLNYFNRVPTVFDEVAIIDGASYGTIVTRVMVPLCVPALISLAVLQFVSAWNTFIWPLIFLQPTSPRNWTAVQMVPALRGAEVVDWSLLSSASILVMVIPVIVFITLHKYYVKGLVAGNEPH